MFTSLHRRCVEDAAQLAALVPPGHHVSGGAVSSVGLVGGLGGVGGARLVSQVGTVGCRACRILWLAPMYVEVHVTVVFPVFSMHTHTFKCSSVYLLNKFSLLSAVNKVRHILGTDGETGNFGCFGTVGMLGVSVGSTAPLPSQSVWLGWWNWLVLLTVRASGLIIFEKNCWQPPNNLQRWVLLTHAEASIRHQ